MADEMIRHIDIDGIPRPLAASNLKKSGRIVIGIEGVHTWDDADVLLGANEDDKVSNWTTLYNTLNNETAVDEFVMLSGTYYLSGYGGTMIPAGKKLCGSGNTVIELDGAYADNGDKIIRMGENSKLTDLKINFKPQSFNEDVIEMNSGCVVDNVTIFANYSDYIAETDSDFAPIGIQAINSSVEILNCVIQNCSTGIILVHGGATIKGCHIRDCGTGIHSFTGGLSTIENNIIFFSSGIFPETELERYAFGEGNGIYVRNAIAWSIIGNTFCYYGDYPNYDAIAINMTYQYDTRIEKNRFEHSGVPLSATAFCFGSIFLRDNVDDHGEFGLDFGDVGSTFSSGNAVVPESKFKQLNGIGETVTFSLVSVDERITYNRIRGNFVIGATYIGTVGSRGDYYTFVIQYAGGNDYSTAVHGGSSVYLYVGETLYWDNAEDEDPYDTVILTRIL